MGITVSENLVTFMLSANVVNIETTTIERGTRCRNWLCHYATSRKVAGSILDRVGPQCDPGVDVASKRNEYQGYLLRDRGRQCVGLTTLLF
jgi:hypothetical protein